MAEMTKHIDSGLFQMGGATLHSPPKGEKLDIHGSAIVARAASAEAVIQVLKQDLYYRSRVWDFGKMQMYPVSTSFCNLTIVRRLMKAQFTCVYRKPI